MILEPKKELWRFLKIFIVLLVHLLMLSAMLGTYDARRGGYTEVGWPNTFYRKAPEVCLNCLPTGLLRNGVAYNLAFLLVISAVVALLPFWRKKAQEWSMNEEMDSEEEEDFGDDEEGGEDGESQLYNVVMQNLHSQQVEGPLEHYSPLVPDNFGIWLQFQVGLEGEPGVQVFELWLCTPRWMAEQHGKDDLVFGHHHLIVMRYDYQAIRTLLHDYISDIKVENREEMIERMRRIALWEGEEDRFLAE